MWGEEVPVLLLAMLACEPWHPERAEVRFPLEGAHLELECSACHPSEPPDKLFVYRKCAGLGPLQDLCLDCHSCDRVLHVDGEDHFPGRSCGEGTTCHSPADMHWTDVIGGGTLPGTETEGQSCAGSCHGPVWEDASPQDTSHRAHLTGQTWWTQPWTCEGCHPGESAPSHADGAIDVAFSGLAVGPGSPESATFSGSSCSVYCHGATMAILPEPPTWNGGATEVACGTCHGFPPGGTHPPSDACSLCHPPTGGSEQQFQDLSTHVDGSLQVE
jgi:predicted CxxxxCH...CXXCH cytochrome family protein